MGTWRCWRLMSVVVASALFMLPGCGGSRPPGPSPFPVRINLNPAISTSLQLGATLTFVPSAQNGSSSITPPFTFQSSDTSILNLAPNGVACAGRWDSTFSTCTPGGTGAVEVTASALGATSPPTLVFVHPPIDNITVTEVTTTIPPPVSGPCFSQGQTITLQATAWSQNTDVTASVGPFTWSANNIAVVKVTPIMNSAFNVPTNQATAAAITPGLTQIFAAVSGVSSSAFQQHSPDPSVIWDFFETCPVQSITLQLGPSGAQQTGQTSFLANKGTAQPVTATVLDILGNTLSNIPLTWSASRPTAVSATSCTTQTCSIGTPGPGAGAVTASCTPPTCNTGFPQVPLGLSSPACPQTAKVDSCQPFIPLPVYSDTAISGVVTGATASTSVLATSLDCFDTNTCIADVYDIPTSRNLAGNPNGIPNPPNSLMFDLAGDKAYMGSKFGSLLVTPGNIGTANNPFSSLGTVTGAILAISPNGNTAIFSDTAHSPNQLYVVTATGSSPGISTFSITGATAAGFSPDGLKAYIIANGGSSIYVYSTLQALQNLTTLPAGTGSANLVAFSPNAAFVYIAGAPSNSPALTPLNLCDNHIATHLVNKVPVPQSVKLDATPAFLKAVPVVHLNGLDSAHNPFPDGAHFFTLDSTGMDVITANNTVDMFSPSNPPPLGSCPQDVTHTVQRINLGLGTFNPVAFFISPDASQAYIVASDRSSILVYDFNTGSVNGSIPLAGNATPVFDPLHPKRPVADMTTDGSLIYVAGSDGLLHQINTAAASDLNQIPFPFLPNLENAFCNLTPTAGPCKLDFVAVKP
jgi:hypothetical protein